MALISCGEALIDIIKLEDSSANKMSDYLWKFLQGGGPYNSAIAAAKLSIPTYFLGEIANDWLGDMLYANLEQANVNKELIGTRNSATPTAIVNEESKGVSYIFHGFSKIEPIISPNNMPNHLPDDVNYFLFGGLASTIEPSSSTILSWLKKQTNVASNKHKLPPIIYFDPNIRPFMIRDKITYKKRFDDYLKYVDIIKLSDDDFDFLFKDQTIDEVFSHFRLIGIKYFILSRGKEGASLYSDNDIINVDTPTIEVKDTVGAGDCFNAAFISSLYRANIKSKSELLNISKTQLQNYLKFSCHAAALCCTKQGANPPTLKQVEEFISYNALSNKY